MISSTIRLGDDNKGHDKLVLYLEADLVHCDLLTFEFILSVIKGLRAFEEKRRDRAMERILEADEGLHREQ